MFIEIYEKEVSFIGVLSQVKLSQIVSKELTQKEYEDLKEYFEDGLTCDCLNDDGVYEFQNKLEFLEDAPLPDGTVIGASSFREMTYVVVLKETKYGMSNKVTVRVDK